ncbi:modification methylase XcyI [Cupriavidus necator N-1]|uniref:Methyltransferase n=1 Tax=Cupriavidus necator (strain ATCC 43291 / DSM 13513 / CCUG 52238 / LMG 8453 / N-1) TaxID=1042878 RepID=G0ES77_CUPNN|nr:site-specific DNA-methyltransferase [Cupriavidus necator]AEI76695.1 modification methylase XcyI [Cupriavidus necator N-1]MDX6014731.1 site-specific DNA-methyltransferase [Cupriavidus necator]
MLTNHCYQGDCREVMRELIAAGVRVQCIVTSPPYWGLRDYGVHGQLGLEASLPEFLANMVEVFVLCRQLLADDGTLWLNMGDSYAGSRGAPWGPSPAATEARSMTASRRRDDTPIPRSDVRVEGLKPKDLVGQPWRLAFALQDSGWWLRQDIVWHKPNPMPESVHDRCTKAHEYVFLLTKSEKYFYDFEAMQEPVSGGAHARGAGVNPKAAPSGWDTSPGGHRQLKGRYSGTGVGFGRGYDKVVKPRVKQNASFSAAVTESVGTRNRRSVWTIPTQSFDGAHFATFPESLVEPCILAGSRPGDIVFDPFMGSGTVASVAQRLGRRWLGAELNPDYIALLAERTRQLGLVLESAA